MSDVGDAVREGLWTLLDRAGRTLRRAAERIPDRHEGIVSHIGPDGLHVTMTPSGLLQWRSQGVAGWRGSAVAYRCIIAIASNAASVPLAVLDPEGRELDRPIVDLWNHKPNPYMSARVQAEITWLRLETSGQTFTFLDRGESGQGKIAGLYPMISWSVQPIIDNTGPSGTEELIGFRASGPAGTVSLLPDEVLWLRYPDPDDQWGCLSPLQAAMGALGLDQDARTFQQSSLKRGGTPGGVVYLGDVDEQTHRQVTADLAARHESPENAGRHLVLSGPVAAKYERIALSAQEVSYLDTRAQSADEIMMAFGVPHDYLAGGTTYENRDAARRTLWSDTIVPKLDVVASEIDLDLLPDPRESATFDTSDVSALAEDETAEVARTTDLVRSDVVTIDEARGRLGLDPLPGGLGKLTWSPYRLAATDAAAPLRAAAAIEGVRAQGPAAVASTFYDRHEAIMVAGLREWFDWILVEALAHVEEIAGRATSAWFDEIEARQVWDETAGAGLSTTWNDAAVRQASVAGIDAGLLDPNVERALRRRSFALAGRTLEQTQQVLDTDVLATGLANGEGVPELAKRVRAVNADLQGWKATQIGRTESVAAFNQAGQWAAETSGVVTRKEWLATMDARTREQHRDVDGEAIPLDGVFTNGLRFPGDPLGPPSQTVNCRCTILHE